MSRELPRETQAHATGATRPEASESEYAPTQSARAACHKRIVMWDRLADTAGRLQADGEREVGPFGAGPVHA